MALTTRTISSLMNGVSRQPAILRSQDQTEDEVNTWGNIAVGLARRPPTVHVADLGVADIEDAFIHHINRDKDERYIVVIANGTLRIFDTATGEEQVVNTPYGTDYLAGASGVFRAVTVADYTFLVNTSIVPALAAVGADEAAPPNYYIPGGYLAYGQGVG